jgi:hypothetical protein
LVLGVPGRYNNKKIYVARCSRSWALVARSLVVLWRQVETFAVYNSEVTVAQNVGRRSPPEAHVNYVRLLDGVGSEVTVCQHLQRRRRVETLAVHNSEVTEAQNVGRRSLSEAHVNYGRLLDGVDSRVTGRRHIQRRHVFLRISPSKNPMKYIIVSAIDHSKGPTYTILVSERCVLGNDDLTTT